MVVASIHWNLKISISYIVSLNCDFHNFLYCLNIHSLNVNTSQKKRLTYDICIFKQHGLFKDITAVIREYKVVYYSSIPT